MSNQVTDNVEHLLKNAHIRANDLTNNIRLLKNADKIVKPVLNLQQQILAFGSTTVMKEKRILDKTLS